MKKVVLTLVFSLVVVTMFAQSTKQSKRLKYVTNGPDGKVAMTIYDDSREDSMKLESAKNFYKYQILDPETSEPIYSSTNKGKECTIDKSKVAAGTYNLRLYTSNFVITSKITVSASRKFAKEVKENDAVAIND